MRRITVAVVVALLLSAGVQVKAASLPNSAVSGVFTVRGAAFADGVGHVDVPAYGDAGVVVDGTAIQLEAVEATPAEFVGRNLIYTTPTTEYTTNGHRSTFDEAFGGWIYEPSLVVTGSYVKIPNSRPVMVAESVVSTSTAPPSLQGAGFTAVTRAGLPDANARAATTAVGAAHPLQTCCSPLVHVDPDLTLSGVFRITASCDLSDDSLSWITGQVSITDFTGKNSIVATLHSAAEFFDPTSTTLHGSGYADVVSGTGVWRDTTGGMVLIWTGTACQPAGAMHGVIGGWLNSPHLAWPKPVLPALP